MKRWSHLLMHLKLKNSRFFNSLPFHRLMSCLTFLSAHLTLKTWFARLLAKSWMPLTISIGVERSTLTLNLQISSSALVDPLEELSRLSLQTLKQLKLLPAMVLKSREHITLTMLLLKSLKKQRPSHNLMSGLLVFFSMFSCRSSKDNQSDVQPWRRLESTGG